MSGTGKGIGGHTRTVGENRGTDTWLTPPEIIAALGAFDLDPCCPSEMPWVTARRMIQQPEDGLSVPWSGRVWLNPPYSSSEKWLEKLAKHGNGIALIFARTETEAFAEHVWAKAAGLCFIRKRLHFHDADGKRAKGNSGGPSVLVAYGQACADRLRDAVRGLKISGFYVDRWE